MEKDIFIKMAHGDHQAFKEVFRQYYAKVKRFAYGIIKDNDEADELAQIIFIRIWDKREHFIHVDNFDSYLFSLAKRTILNYISTKIDVFSAIDKENDDYCGADSDSPYENLLASDLQLLIDITVSKMPYQRQCIYKMSRQLGLTNEEISVKLGIQKKTVENHLNLALKELRNVISLFLISYLILIN